MSVSSEELIKEIELLELEVKAIGKGEVSLYEVRMEPGLIEKIRRCQEKMMEEERESMEEIMTGEDIKCIQDEKGMMRYTSRIWIPNIP